MPGLVLPRMFEQSTMPLLPSQKVTASLYSGRTDSARIRQGAAGIIPAAEFSWVAVWLDMDSSPP